MCKKINIKKNKYLSYYLLSIFFIGFILFNFNVNYFNDSYINQDLLSISCFAGDDNDDSFIKSVANKVVSYLPVPSMEDIANGFLKAFAWFLNAATAFIGVLITVVIRIWEFSISPVFMNAVFDNKGIEAGWKVVRDLFNVFFIFFLLFSAFATVFQVKSYHIKSTIVMIIVMALLVNFSWPITRIIIDFSNITMLSMTASIEEYDGIATIINSTKVKEITTGEAYYGNEENTKTKKGEPSAYNSLIAAMMSFIFSLIVFFVIFMYPFIFFTRIIIMSILLVLAPIGFVFLAFPSTKGVAKKWWTTLFQQAFVGPILIFFFLLSVQVFKSSTIEEELVSVISGNDSNISLIKSLLSTLLSVLFLFIGLIAAKATGGQATSLAMGAASKARRFIGAKMMGGIRGGAKSIDSGVFGGRVTASAQRANNFFNPFSKERAQNRDDTHKAQVSAIVAGGDPEEAVERMKEQKERKRIKDAGVTESDSENRIASGNVTDSAIIKANLENALKGEDFGKNRNNYRNLIRSLDNLTEVEREQAMKKIDKAYIKNGNSDIVYDRSVRERIAREQREGGGAPLNDTQINNIRMEEAKKIHGGMNAETFAKQENLMESIDNGELKFQHIAMELNNRLNNPEFARGIQRYANNDMLERFKNVNRDKFLS
jgi:hypothetical protein